MKRILILCAVMIATVGSVSAQSWLDALKGAATDVIDEVTGVSKKMFKRSLGMLLKSGRVKITDNGIKLK